ncbi:MAG: CRISPR-associated endonuclease Cas3'', partial [Planctomycetota bacterium]
MSDHTGVTAPPNGPRQPWAKLLHAIPDDRSSPVVGELSLVQHCLDVGAIAAALIGYDPIDQRTKPTALRSRLARLADRDDLGPVQCARLCCLAALHDLGKANRGFQNKRQKDRTPIAGHVGPAIELIDSIPREAASLFAKSRSFGPAADALPIATLETWFGAGPARELLTTVLCHHGGPPHGDVARTDGKGLWQAEGDADPARWLRELVAAIQAAFPLAWEESDPIEA